MIPVLVTLAIVTVAVPAWVVRKYRPPGPITMPVATRYLLLCLLMFLCGLLAWRDPLLVEWAPLVLGASGLFAGAVIVVVWGELCPS